MDPDVIHDPVFRDLLLKSELGIRKLRDAVIAMRGFYLRHDKGPQEESTTESWRGAVLSEDAAQKFEAAREAAAQLLRYAYEIAPKSSMFWDMEEVRSAKAAHWERLARVREWSGARKTMRGLEERVHIDEGPPVTVVIRPEHYDFTAKARKARQLREQQKPAMTGDELGPALEQESDAESNSTDVM